MFAAPLPSLYYGNPITSYQKSVGTAKLYRNNVRDFAPSSEMSFSSVYSLSKCYISSQYVPSLIVYKKCVFASSSALVVVAVDVAKDHVPPLTRNLTFYHQTIWIAHTKVFVCSCIRRICIVRVFIIEPECTLQLEMSPVLDFATGMTQQNLLSLSHKPQSSIPSSPKSCNAMLIVTYLTLLCSYYLYYIYGMHANQ